MRGSRKSDQFRQGLIINSAIAQIGASLSRFLQFSCPVCQRDLSNNREVLITHCGHHYHEDCIDAGREERH
ncbi:RING finger protein [Endozoicomonas sp. ONNA2]|uniref:RING finger protein n=1 Tax=Endozoicomonas sp. ONNA2 TaxID=2828741 RepID=UPI0035A12556